jgi:hypothetical protein
MFYASGKIKIKRISFLYFRKIKLFPFK